MSKEKVVQVPRGHEVVFPKLCPRCLRPTDMTFNLRQSEQRHFGLGWKTTEFQVPICDQCYTGFKTRAWVISRVLGFSLVGLAIAFLILLKGTTRWVAVICTALAGGIAKQYNPSGIEVLSSPGNPWTWRFPTAQYAKLFAEANKVTVLADTPKKPK